MRKFLEALSPGEPPWAVALQVGFIALAMAYFVGHFVAAVLAGRLVP